MKFFIIFNKWSNFYFFIQNLSEWHFSCRKPYNALWKKELGPSTVDEKKALKKFKKIHLKYPFGKKYLGRPFFIKKNPWKALEKKLTAKEFKDLQNIFLIFQKKFEKLYKKELSSLKKWKQALSKKINNKYLKNKIIDILSTLYHTKPKEKKINVYLLFSKPYHLGGKANIDKYSISIEISRLPLSCSNRAIGLIWHEIIHLLFDKVVFFQLIQRELPKRKNVWRDIKEITAYSLFPQGVIAKKFLKCSYPRFFFKENNKNRTHQLLELMNKYIAEKKSLDKIYIKQVLNILNPGKRKG